MGLYLQLRLGMKTLAFLFLMTLGFSATAVQAEDSPPPPRTEAAIPTCKASIQALLTTSRIYQKEIDFEATKQCSDVGNCGMTAEDQQALQGHEASVEKLRAELEQETALTENLCSK
jgi:hypothetical protein